MDDVYDPRRFCCSEPINLARFLETSKKDFLLPSAPYARDRDPGERDEVIKKLMNVDISTKELAELREMFSSSAEVVCGGRQQQLGGQLLGSSPKCLEGLRLISPEARRLHTVDRLQQRQHSEAQPISQLLWKYKKIRHTEEKFPDQSQQPDLTPGEEILIRIRVYFPFAYKRGNSNKNRNPKFHFELTVLGSQTLDVLRDKVTCPNDLGLHVDISDTPDVEHDVDFKDVFKSGFLFIDGTFYNDTRHPNNIDYSECIRDWARSKSVGPFKTACMETTKFKDLTVRLGYPQVYQHQGDCEHLFTFSDVEVLQPSHTCCSSYYPQYRSMALQRAKYCYVCGKYVCKWLVVGSDRIPFDPAFYCDSCFRSYNYIDGKKVGTFKAYHFYDGVHSI